MLALLDHLIRSRQDIWRNRETDLLGGFQVNDQLKPLWLLYREIGRLRAFENLVDIRGSASEQVGNARAIGHKPPVFHKFWITVYRREPALYREVCNLFSLRI